MISIQKIKDSIEGLDTDSCQVTILLKLTYGSSSNKKILDCVEYKFPFGTSKEEIVKAMSSVIEPVRSLWGLYE